MVRGTDLKPYYDEGGITIYHGDSLDILPTLPKVSLVVTDPPYVIGAVSAGNMASKAGSWGDMMNSSRWFTSWYRLAANRLTRTGAIWTFCNWRSLPVVMKAAIDAQLPVASALVWHKDWIGPGGTVGLRPSYEMVALLPMPDFVIPNRGLPDVWTHQWASHKPNGHPAEKPVPLLRRIIAESQPVGVVLDPFMGSGSSLVAAKDLGLSAIGIESEERYCEIAVQRLAQGVLEFDRG
jgi:site-specific DNA-methyltransferase (adenine-specific)